MIDFHANDHPSLNFQDIVIASQKHILAGNVSVLIKNNLKPVILIRQDEAFFNENATNTLKWVGQIGNTHYYPKIWTWVDDLGI